MSFTKFFKIQSVFIILLSAGFILFTQSSCKEKKKVRISKPYTGPAMEVYNVSAIFTDSAQPKVWMKAPKQLEMINGDRIFPKGVNVEFYGEKSKKSSVLTSNSGKYVKETNIYTVTNNVVIVNKEDGKTLHTELLHWNPTTRKIYTDKFVRIETPNELLTGTGLESNEDFSSYRILKVSGIFPLKE